jgi:hypothetical protein
VLCVCESSGVSNLFGNSEARPENVDSNSTRDRSKRIDLTPFCLVKAACSSRQLVVKINKTHSEHFQ